MQQVNQEYNAVHFPLIFPTYSPTIRWLLDKCFTRRVGTKLLRSKRNRQLRMPQLVFQEMKRIELKIHKIHFKQTLRGIQENLAKNQKVEDYVDDVMRFMKRSGFRFSPTVASQSATIRASRYSGIHHAIQTIPGPLSIILIQFFDTYFNASKVCNLNVITSRKKQYALSVV